MINIHMMRLRKNLVAGAVGFGMPAAVMLVSFSILLHHVGAVAFGVLQLAQAIGNGAGFVDLGLANATVYFIAQHHSEQDYARMGGIVATSTACMGALIAFLSVGLALLAPLLPALFNVPAMDAPGAVTVFRLAALQMLFAPFILIIGAYFKGAHRFDYSSALLCLLSIATWGAAALLCLILPMDIVGVAATFVSGTGLTAAAGLVFFFAHGEARKIPRSALRPLLRIFQEMWGYSAAVFGQGIAVLINNQLQRLLVGAVLGPVAVAVYTAALQLTTKIHAGIGATFEAFFPFSVSMRSKVEFRRVYRRIQVASLGLGVACLAPLVLFADVICRLWLGPALAPNVVPLVRTLCVATLFMVVSIPTYNVLNGMRRPWFNFYFMLLTILVTGAALLLLPRPLSVASFVYAYTVAACVTVVCMFGYTEWFVRRLTAVPHDTDRLVDLPADR